MLKLVGGSLLFLGLFAAIAAAAEPVEVVVEGLGGEVLKNVQTALTLPADLVREGKVDRLWLTRFEGQIPEKVRRAMEPFGYYESRVEVSLEATQGGIYRLRVHVEPGPPLRVTSVKVEIHGLGSGEQKLKELLGAFPLKEGDILRQDKYEQAKQALKAQALELGYLDADFQAHEIRVSLAERKAAIDLTLETGPQYRFGEATFTGDLTYPKPFLRRYLAFKPGEVFSSLKIARTQLNFINSDRFAEVTIDPRKQEAEDLMVPVRINLIPSKPKRFRAGVGYDTDIGARVFARYQDMNVRRSGHELNAELNLAQRLQGLVANYAFPSVQGIDSKTLVQLGLQHERTDSYDSKSIYLGPEYVHSFVGESDSLYSLGRGSLGSAYVQLRLERFTVGDEEGEARLVMPGVRFMRRQYDDLIRPTKGYGYGLELRGATQYLGSDSNFLQFQWSGNMLVSLPFRFGLFLRAQGGATLTDSFDSLPPSVRFFAGGQTNVRGYAWQSLGPTDASGNVVGGKHLLTGTVELEKAIGKIFGIAAFYDAGNAFDSYSHMDLQQDAGIGVRLYTPLGAMRLDLARQVGVKDPDFRVVFTVGFGL